MLAKLADAGLPVLLAGMLAPPNLGRDYGEAFNAIYPRLAEQHDVPLYPFFLDGVAAQRALHQADGIHPNAKGVAEIVARSQPHVVRLLEAESLAERPTGGPAGKDRPQHPAAKLTLPTQLDTEMRIAVGREKGGM